MKLYMDEGVRDMKTVFITGASSGIGKETAKYFAQNGWQVAATMRKPELEKELNKLDNVALIRCDVTDTESIQGAIKETISKFGGIDVLVNNAGYYTVGVLEAATKEQIQRQLDTNLLGLIETTKMILPYLKQSKGIIINLSSIAGIVSIPLQSLYHATKFAIEGFSESLQYELRPFGVRVKLIEPGTIKTDFYGRSMTVIQTKDKPEYQEYSTRVLENLSRNGNDGSAPVGVAKTIYTAATDGKKKMRYPTGKMKQMIMMRHLLPLRVYQWLIRKVME